MEQISRETERELFLKMRECAHVSYLLISAIYLLSRRANVYKHNESAKVAQKKDYKNLFNQLSNCNIDSF
jgi:hypothetical protein